MLKITDDGHIDRSVPDKDDSILAQRRKEIAERLRAGNVVEIRDGDIVFEAFEQNEPRVAIVGNKEGVCALAFLDLGILKISQPGRQYRVSDAFEIDISVEEQLSACQKVINVLFLLRKIDTTKKLGNSSNDSNVQQVDWKQISDWLEKSPISFPLSLVID